jgi:hypothetical protein
VNAPRPDLVGDHDCPRRGLAFDLNTTDSNTKKNETTRTAIAKSKPMKRQNQHAQQRESYVGSRIMNVRAKSLS